ncbi:uncharacterized protein PAC_04977 [Phialocephala subalpina]|uniref:Uncharacterized protein n=1 Tax=Phialocephala subalpina TaxID=576137 RepID=A0A1L7WQR5_9HELO|nr:uncharacterized protein PAC_04977 [Phialocephala subalpina]
MASIDNAIGASEETEISWNIRGEQNNWNWKVAHVEDGDWKSADDIVYQTRFPSKELALMYKGTGDSAQLLATIDILDTFDAKITFPKATSQEPIMMENIEGAGNFKNRWSVKVKALGGRELHWEWEHLVIGGRPMTLEDPVTKEEFGAADGNDHYLSLSTKLPEAARDELLITSAANILLTRFMHNDMTIAAEGPEGCAQWKYQPPNWWENENEEEKGERNEEFGKQREGNVPPVQEDIDFPRE